MGDIQLDRNYWGSPEKWSAARPAYSLDARKGGTDVIAMTSAALAAAAVAIKGDSSQVGQRGGGGGPRGSMGMGRSPWAGVPGSCPAASQQLPGSPARP